VGDRDRGVVPPCGRCRQVLLDYFPAVKVIVGGEDDCTRTVRITDLLPEGYVWADHQFEAE
jgi:cytidine deaminase